MYISHSVMEGQQHITPLTRVAFVYNGQKGMELAPNPHYSAEVGKALGGSFKLGTLAPKTVREMTQLPKETQKNGDTNKSKRTNKHAKHKPRLNMHAQKHTRPNRAL